MVLTKTISPSDSYFNLAEAAQRENARRLLAQQSLIDFCAYVDPDAAKSGAKDRFVESRYRAKHLILIAKYIEAAVDGRLWKNVSGRGKKVLLITTPPGHWKSSLVSRKFPAWYVGRGHTLELDPQIILTSYNSSLAESNNGAVLELVKDSALYRNVFPDVKISRQSQSQSEWRLEGKPYPTCVAAGVGGGLTGHHGLVVVDDPIKDRAQANSPSYVQMLWEWWSDVVRTRPRANDFILGIWTRWTEQDPAGKLLTDKRDGLNDDQIVYLRLPALAETEAERQSAASMGLPVDKKDPLGREPGEALWPDEVDIDDHQVTRKSFPVTFDSLYQGRPRPQGGFVVGRANFKILPSEPSHDIHWVAPVDWAYTEKQVAPKKTNDPDYTAIGKVGLWTPGGNRDDARLVIAFLARKQCNQHEARQFVKFNLMALGKRVPCRSAQEGVDILYLDAMRRDADLVEFSIKNLTRLELSGDKMTKATPWLEMAHAGLVYLVNGSWNDEFLQSVERFPHGAHDDLEDVVSVGVHALGMGKRDKKATSSNKVKFYGRK